MKNISTESKVGQIPGMYRGLCLTCKQADTCNFPRDVERPIMSCEEFDGYVLHKRSKETPFKTSPKPISSCESKVSATHTGLCINCDNRETCTYPKSDKTIRCCEEYR